MPSTSLVHSPDEGAIVLLSMRSLSEAGNNCMTAILDDAGRFSQWTQDESQHNVHKPLPTGSGSRNFGCIRTLLVGGAPS